MSQPPVIKLPTLKKINKDYIKYSVGSMRNGFPVAPPDARKKILLLGDDLRTFSGIATVSKDLVQSTCHLYNWVQLAASIKSPDNGRVIDLSRDIQNETGVESAKLILYGNDGYGDQNKIRQLIQLENPDMIIHFTDPRFWGWLYDMEREIREICPLGYLNIWDDTPDPQWNTPFYESCDLLMAISKQTYGINQRLLEKTGKYNIKRLPFNEQHSGSNGVFYQVDPDAETKVISYVPHGIDSKYYFPIDKTEHPEDYNIIENFEKKFFSNGRPKMVMYCSNRNIARKHIPDIMLSMKELVDQFNVPKEDVALIIHTDPVDEPGTDLPAVKRDLFDDLNIIIDPHKRPKKELNALYNLADIVVSMSSNEGFGLSTAEALMAGTMIVTNVTGGLQDQLGFKSGEFSEYIDDYVVRFKQMVDAKDGDPIAQTEAELKAEFDEMLNGTSMNLSAEDYIEIGTNADGQFKNSGDWGIPVFPNNRSLQGSIATPYIFDDRASHLDFAKALHKAYCLPSELRKQYGLKGRKYVMDKFTGMEVGQMGERVIRSIEECFSVWEPRERFELIKA